jgi:hypothetical protein
LHLSGITVASLYLCTKERETIVDLFTEDDLRELISVHFDNCISIYLPTIRNGAEMQQNPIRFKNQVNEAEKQLMERGLRRAKAATLLDPAKRLLENESFWQKQGDGLAVFIALGIFKVYRLPVSFHQITNIAPSFHLKPILSSLTGNTRFYLLDLNINGVRLFAGSRFSFFQIRSDKIPAGIRETLQFDIMDSRTQFASKPSMASNNNITVFGYGRITDNRKAMIKTYYDQVSKAVTEIIQNTNAPLLLIGTDYLHSLYKEANQYWNLVEDGIQIDPQNLTEEEIFHLAWPTVEPLFQSNRLRDTNLYKQLSGEHKPIAVNDLKTIVSGSMHGRIGTLFIKNGTTNVWGKFKEDKLDIEVHDEKKPGDEDLLDKAAINTMLRGGTVYIVEPEDMPDRTPAAAIMRY